jgi:hypothetical protein
LFLFSKIRYQSLRLIITGQLPCSMRYQNYLKDPFTHPYFITLTAITYYNCSIVHSIISNFENGMVTGGRGVLTLPELSTLFPISFFLGSFMPMVSEVEF